jgi:hypothetical protein
VSPSLRGPADAGGQSRGCGRLRSRRGRFRYRRWDGRPFQSTRIQRLRRSNRRLLILPRWTSRRPGSRRRARARADYRRPTAVLATGGKRCRRRSHAHHGLKALPKDRVISVGSCCRFPRLPPETKFAADSALEETGFELMVPLADLGRSGPEPRNVIFTPPPRPRPPVGGLRLAAVAFSTTAGQRVFCPLS